MALQIPDPNAVFPNAYKTSCFLKNVVQAPNAPLGTTPIMTTPQDPTGFEKNNILFNYPEFGDRLTIGKFCCLASGTTFVMGAANHRLCSVATYPSPCSAAPGRNAPPHLDQLPEGGYRCGQRCVVGRERWSCPGCASGTGPSCGLFRGDEGRGPLYPGGRQPARFLKTGSPPADPAPLGGKVVGLGPPAALAEALPMLCSPDLEQVKAWLRDLGYGAAEI